MFPITVFMTYKMTKYYADKQTIKQLEAELIINEDDQVVTLEEITERLPNSSIVNLNQQPVTPL